MLTIKIMKIIIHMHERCAVKATLKQSAARTQQLKIAPPLTWCNSVHALLRVGHRRKPSSEDNATKRVQNFRAHRIFRGSHHSRTRVNLQPATSSHDLQTLKPGFGSMWKKGSSRNVYTSCITANFRIERPLTTQVARAVRYSI